MHKSLLRKKNLRRLKKSLKQERLNKKKNLRKMQKRLLRKKNLRRMQPWTRATATADRAPQGFTHGDAMGSVFTKLAALEVR